MDIIAVESPIQVAHLLKIYVRGAGIGKLGHQIETELLKAIDRLLKRGEIEKEAQGKSNDKLNWVLRKVGSPNVRLRSPGTRTLDEIPLREIAELMKRFPSIEGDELFRMVLNAYGFKRMTSNVKSVLEAARLLNNSATLPSQKAEGMQRDVDLIPTPNYFTDPDKLN